MSLSHGTRLGPYEIVAPLGAGGMGEVYRARDSKLKREVAIKVLPEAFATDPQALARFEREALAVAALSHPNILSIHDFGHDGGIAYAVMELLEGETLRAKLAAGPPPQKLAVDYALQIAKGLSAAHQEGSRPQGPEARERVRRERRTREDPRLWPGQEDRARGERRADECVHGVATHGARHRDGDAGLHVP
jgi:serine/threonine protein kinase